MNHQQTTILNKLRALRAKFKWNKLLYPSLSFLFITIIGILFALSVNRISGLLDAVFDDYGDTSVLLTLDKENYSVVAKKLNITVAAQETTSTDILPDENISLPQNSTPTIE